MCNYDLYRSLEKECNPDRYFDWLKTDMISDIADYDEEAAEEVESWINCTSGFIRRYMKLATGCMSDRELYKFYTDVLKMIDEGISSREYQKSIVDEELMEAEDLYYNEVIDDDKYDEIRFDAEEIKSELDRDIEDLKKIREFCLSAKDRTDVVICIEKVANMAHSRGSMLPVMCGAYLPERIVGAVTGIKNWPEFAVPEDVGLELSRIVPKIMDCIKDFR